MAIRFQTYGNTATSGTSATVSVAAGATGRKAVILIKSDGSTPTSVTVDGNAATLVRADSFGGNVNLAMYYYDSPPATAVNYVANQTGSAAIEIAVLIYSGMATGAPDSSAQNSAASATSVTVSTTVSAPTCWLVGAGNNSGTGPSNAGTGTTIRTGATDVEASYGDSNSVVTPGSRSMTWTSPAAASHRAIVAAFMPATEIAFDAVSGVDVSGAASSHTLSHTCSGSNRLLLVGVNPDQSRTVTGVTYNGVAMTQQAGFVVTGSATQRVELWYLIAPASGANNIVVTTSGVCEPSIRAVSYTGVKQTGFPNAADNEDQAATADLTSTITTIADGALGVVIARSNSALSAGAGAKSRTSGNSAAFDFFDTKGGQLPAGSMSLTTSGGSSYHAHAMVAFAPIEPSSGIVFDKAAAADSGGDTGSASVSLAAAEANEKAIIFVAWENAMTFSSLTVNGSSTGITQIGSEFSPTDTNLDIRAYYLDNPPTSSVAYTISATPALTCRIAVILLKGAKTGAADSSASGEAATTSVTLSTTVVAEDCWLLGVVGEAGDTATIVGGNGTAYRVGATSSFYVAGDSAGTVGTGAQTLQFIGGASTTDIGGIIVSVAPAPVTSELSVSNNLNLTESNTVAVAPPDFNLGSPNSDFGRVRGVRIFP